MNSTIFFFKWSIYQVQLFSQYFWCGYLAVTNYVQQQTNHMKLGNKLFDRIRWNFLNHVIVATVRKWTKIINYNGFMNGSFCSNNRKDTMKSYFLSFIVYYSGILMFLLTLLAPKWGGGGGWIFHHAVSFLLISPKISVLTRQKRNN